MNRSSNIEALSDAYDAYYFVHSCGRPYQRDDEWLRFFDNIAERIVRDLRPRTVLDAGCAMGFLVERLREREVEAFGIDVSEYAISHVHPVIAPFCTQASVTELLAHQYDLIVCIEVLEHLKPREAELAILNFCQHTRTILFSSTPYDYREATHFNVQPPEYWAERFAQFGFFRDLDFDATFITPWALCVRHIEQTEHRVVRDYERRLWALSQENRELRSLAVELRNELSSGYLRHEQRGDLSGAELPDIQDSPGPVTNAKEGPRLRNGEELERLRSEKEYWQDLAGRYASGRLMRLMGSVHELKVLLARILKAK